MKRELKFRAWQNYGKGHTLMLYDRGDLSEFFDATVGDIIMQFTGLKDKNGKEIYEGDIIFYQNKYEKIEIPSVYYWEASEDVDFLDVRRCKVVGNIYENPELLNQ